MKQEIQLSQFFNEDYIDFSVYDNVRKIASYADGQKNAARKILHTVLQQNISSFTKVSNRGPKVQDFTQYLHGSLEGSIVNMTADYVGSGNNLPVLRGDGNFGSAFIPSPAASRYIFAKLNEDIKDVFLKDDTVNLIEQFFEGDKIEPKFYVPIIPMLAVNGSEGMSIGFAQKILPRNPKAVAKWVKTKAETGQSVMKGLEPFWKGQTFTVEQGEASNQWIIKGSFKRITRNKLEIDSLPVGYDLKQYQDVLDRLSDDKVIRGYDDLSDDDVFKFVVDVEKAFSDKPDQWILDKLKLVKRVSENYTCIDTNNKIVVFNNLEEILEEWWKLRVEFNQKRKDFQVNRLTNEINQTSLKKSFITGVVDEKIELRNRSEKQIEQDAISYDADLEGQVGKFINLPLKSITKEEIIKLNKQIAEQQAELKQWKEITLSEISVKDVSVLL
jgi:DNA topoisomerase-2